MSVFDTGERPTTKAEEWLRAWLDATGFDVVSRARDGATWVAKRRQALVAGTTRAYDTQELGVVVACRETLRTGVAQGRLNGALAWAKSSPGRSVSVAVSDDATSIELLVLRGATHLVHLARNDAYPLSNPTEKPDRRDA